MDTNIQAIRCRSDQLVIVPLSAVKLKQLTEEIEQGLTQSKTTSDFISPVSDISDCFVVFDVEREKCHSICVHRVDYRPGFKSKIGILVKFSKWCYAPCRATKLRLASPEFYRIEENLPPGIGDRYDSTLRKDASPWMRNRSLNNSVEAEITFTSSSEPWVYCTSHILSSRSLRALTTKFSDEYGYDAMTQIKDANAYAKWLGIDFALQIDKRNHLKLNALDMLTYYRSSYFTDCWQQNGPQHLETIVHVYHGPVHYEDQSGVVTTDEEMVDIHGSVRAWFTKWTELSDQSEYRFVITTPGAPRNKFHKIQVSEELRRLTLAM